MKKNLNEIALFGGQPAFGEKLHVGRPNIGDRAKLMLRINDLLDRRWLTNDGPFVQELESKIAAYLNVKHCIAICNATIGLEIAIRALDLSGEVIVPSFTFIATAHALQWHKIVPVFCDIDPITMTLDPERVEELITPRTTGIMGVHLWGQPCDVVKLEEIAERHNLRLFYDSAHAFGCSYRGKMIGNFGDAEVFSFHATKFFNTFEGGAVTTNDDDLAARIRLMRNFGFSGYDNVVSLGTNGKMSEISAAMGLTGLESLEEFIRTNFEHYQHYQRELEHVPGLRVVTYDQANKSNYQYIVLEIDASVTGLGRDDLLSVLWAENVMARRYFYPGCHRMEPYRSLYPWSSKWLPVTEQKADRTIALPTGTAVTAEDISTICQIIRLAFRHGSEIQSLRSAAVANRSQAPFQMEPALVSK